MPPRKQSTTWLRRGAPWTLAELKRLGKVPDSALARRTGRTIKEVVAMREARRVRLRTAPRRWTAREIRLLGRFPDAEVARRLHRSHESVVKGIAPCAPAWRPFTPKEDSLLGTLPDRELGQRLGRTMEVIRWRRLKLGLPYLNPKHRYWTEKDGKWQIVD
jgi:hypothetical protein